MCTSPRSSPASGIVACHVQSHEEQVPCSDPKNDPLSSEEGDDNGQVAATKHNRSLRSYWRLGTRVRCLTKEPGGLVTCDEEEEEEVVQWQWEHRKGFRDYHPASSARIEAAFQRGEFHVRLRSGKGGETPMELFFLDMIQYDTRTGNRRRIRRIGRMTWSDWLRRIRRMLMRMLETGRTERIIFARYEKRRHEIAQILNPNLQADEALSNSCFAAIARSQFFSMVAMAMVLLNAMWIGIEADCFGSVSPLWEAEVPVQVVEHFFCSFFTLELLIRFLAFKQKWRCLRNSWFVFDFFIVVLMAIDTWFVPLCVAVTGSASNTSTLGQFGILRMARILRLTRLGRIVRLLQALPEVMTLLKGIAAAMRTLCCTILLLGVLLYIFGVVFTSQSSDNANLRAMFPTVPASMWVLLVHGTFMDAPSTVLNDIAAESSLEAAIFLLFIILSSFTVLDMLIGILVDVVQKVGASEKEHLAVAYLKNTLLELLECHDKDDDQHIHKSEFELLMRNPEMHVALTRFGVNVSDLISLQDLLFEDTEDEVDWESSQDSDKESTTTPQPIGTKKLSFLDFLEVVLRLRGGNCATVTDVVELRKYMRQRLDRLEESLVRRAAALPASSGCNSHRAIAGPPPSPGHLQQAIAQLADLQTFQHGLVEQQAVWQQQAAAKQQEMTSEMQKLQVQLADVQQVLQSVAQTGLQASGSFGTQMET